MLSLAMVWKVENNAYQVSPHHATRICLALKGCADTAQAIMDTINTFSENYKKISNSTDVDE